MEPGDEVRITADQPDYSGETPTIPAGTTGIVQSYEDDGEWFIWVGDELILIHESELEAI